MRWLVTHDPVIFSFSVSVSLSWGMEESDIVGARAAVIPDHIGLEQAGVAVAAADGAGEYFSFSCPFSIIFGDGASVDIGGYAVR